MPPLDVRIDEEPRTRVVARPVDPLTRKLLPPLVSTTEPVALKLIVSDADGVTMKFAFETGSDPVTATRVPEPATVTPRLPPEGATKLLIGDEIVTPPLAINVLVTPKRDVRPPTYTLLLGLSTVPPKKFMFTAASPAIQIFEDDVDVTRDAMLMELDGPSRPDEIFKLAYREDSETPVPILTVSAERPDGK